MKKSFFKKAMTLAVVCAISVESACLIKEKQNQEAQAYVGIGYLAAKEGASAEACAIIGVAGVWESAVQGFAWGAAFGGVAGAAAGAIAGL
ncbi:hypothetical protein [Prevotella sp. lc2012]|uniref:hypothetical protein n=1 Tax=Prevotella sp. lc2012 TaxID=1761886 RepID=UPI00089D38A9|nr:hypothetical protein [Prevotella sp. lc2012]SEE48611.1 hypothetical protein SAMN04487828_1780 [Prevotella sp. lc2012]